MNLSNQDVQLGQLMFTSSATPQHALGQRGSTADGRVYRYVKVGAVDTEAGKIYQSPADVVGYHALVLQTSQVGFSIGSPSIAPTVVSAAAVGLFSDGYAVIASSAGQGYMYQIERSPAVSAGAVGVFTFYPEDALQVALNSTSIVTLQANKYSGIIVVPAVTATGLIVGVATYIITAAQFGWIQTWGPCAVKCNTAEAVGQMMNGIAASCGAAAALTSPAVTACQIIGQYIGRIAYTGVAGQYVVLDLTISP